mmetsp:Transcript_8168/g.10001  ORF Transcript_8168/g.10001 Transcript_8168/m.10001 type:complete len:603 (+) Transcript_8168:34-1842(+)
MSGQGEEGNDNDGNNDVTETSSSPPCEPQSPVNGDKEGHSLSDGLRTKTTDASENSGNTVLSNSPQSNLKECLDEEFSGLPPHVLARALKDAKAQIMSLTEERDAALNMVVSSSSSSDALMAEIQSSLQTQMNARAEAEDKLRQSENTIQQFQVKDAEIEKMQARVEELVMEKSRVETELEKLREGKEEADRREALYASRLNEAKKKEANMSQQANLHESTSNNLLIENKKLEKRLTDTTLEREKLKQSLEKLKLKCVERVKSVEASLNEERSLNAERKSKMKSFVQTKAEELRTVKSRNETLVGELDDARAKLRELRERLAQLTSELTVKDKRIKELQQRVVKMKKDSEQLHKIGDSLENELHKTAKETEEHKTKRLTAKHELMTILRKLEVEQSHTKKLRDCLKLTFAPKALSQQQLLREGICHLEQELEGLARYLGKNLSLPPREVEACINGETFGSTSAVNRGDTTADISPSESLEEEDANTSLERPAMMDRQRSNGSRQGPKNVEWDSNRLISNLEDETQRVSQGIMALLSCVERLHFLIADPGERGCMTALQELLTKSARTAADGEEVEMEEGDINGKRRKKDKNKYGGLPAGEVH